MLEVPCSMLEVPCSMLEVQLFHVGRSIVGRSIVQLRIFAP